MDIVLDEVFIGAAVVTTDTRGGGGGGRAVGLIVLHTFGGCDVISHGGLGLLVVVIVVAVANNSIVIFNQNNLILVKVTHSFMEH